MSELKRDYVDGQTLSKDGVRALDEVAQSYLADQDLESKDEKLDSQELEVQARPSQELGEQSSEKGNQLQPLMMGVCCLPKEVSQLLKTKQWARNLESKERMSPELTVLFAFNFSAIFFFM